MSAPGCPVLVPSVTRWECVTMTCKTLTAGRRAAAIRAINARCSAKLPLPSNPGWVAYRVDDTAYVAHPAFNTLWSMDWAAIAERCVSRVS